MKCEALRAGMLQAGARAVMASLWSIDDKATYLFIIRFAQEWFPNLQTEPPAAALAPHCDKSRFAGMAEYGSHFSRIGRTTSSRKRIEKAPFESASKDARTTPMENVCSSSHWLTRLFVSCEPSVHITILTSHNKMLHVRIGEARYDRDN